MSESDDNRSPGRGTAESSDSIFNIRQKFIAEVMKKESLKGGRSLPIIWPLSSSSFPQPFDVCLLEHTVSSYDIVLQSSKFSVGDTSGSGTSPSRSVYGG